MSWDDHTQPMFHVTRTTRPSMPTTRRLALTLRTHIERARVAAQRADVERMVRRVPPPSFFAIGVLLGVMLAMTVITASPRANAATAQKLPTAATSLAPHVLFVDRPGEHTRAVSAPRMRFVATRARAQKADAIFAAAL
ncbi:MAG TPA: hypothetical protein VIF62_24920 [Labilithrix sp.]